MPKVPVTFLGVETSEVPNVVSAQLGLVKGFGPVVDYVVPDSPAAAAGLQQNDIIKMLNDQILTEPDQLAKLLRSYSEGTSVTLKLLRESKEQKVSVKLAKREMPQHPGFGPGPHNRPPDGPFGKPDFGLFWKERDSTANTYVNPRLGGDERRIILDAVLKARQEAMRARDEARMQIRRAGDQIRILSNDQNAIKSTKIEIGKAQIVFSDDKGELRVEKVDGKKILTAKDPQGMLLFSGPAETQQDLDKVPVDVRQRYEKLQQNDLPAVLSPGGVGEQNDSMEMEDEGDDAVELAEQV